MKRKSFLNFTLSIRQKIIGGFLIIILIFNINGVFSVISINQSDAIIRESAEVVNPSLEQIENFRLLVTQSRMYITNWVYQQASTEEERTLLKNLHTSYPDLKDRLSKLKTQWADGQQIASIDSVIVAFDKVVKLQKKIMNDLAEEEDYKNDALVTASRSLLLQNILPESKLLLSKLEVLSRKKQNETEYAKVSLIEAFNRLRLITVGLGAFLLFGGLISAFIISGNITQPIKYINGVFEKIGTGELPADGNRTFDNDEIGQMANSADKLINNLRSISSFAESIGKGDYQASFTPVSEKDVLGNALVEMRNNLARVAEEDRRRNWQNEGIAFFGNLLQKNNNDIEQLSDVIISNLVKYIKANQGGLFIVNEQTDGSEFYMTLASCYAWDRKKFLEQKVFPGDGLAGQAWQEQRTIYLTEVPQDYVKITSGLGEANPNCILIVPLRVNEEVFGVVELASFNEMQSYEIDFVEKVAEGIASAIASVRISQRTRLLLDESSQMSQQIQEKEQAIRKSSEQLEKARLEMELTRRTNQERDALIDATNLIIEVDAKFIIQKVNKLVEKKLGYTVTQMQGMALDFLFDSYTKLDEAKLTLMKGVAWSDFVTVKDRGFTKYKMKLAAVAIHNENNQIEKYFFLISDLEQTDI
ncbi:MAG TPA: histidine kinase [Microscillaceae bacterium]|nr:histidine kinase [Microscillaceae bacterium]